MGCAPELAPPRALPTSLQVERLLGSGSSSDVFLVVEPDSTRAILKLGKTPNDAPSIATEMWARVMGASHVIDPPTAVGWLQVTDSAAAPFVASAPHAGRPALLLPARSGVPLDRHHTWSDAAESRFDLAKRVIRDVGTALEELHRGGLSHGDVKPANIVLLDDGHATLIDFGLASDASEPHVRGATPRYLASRDRTLGDGRARDRLALGVVLAELLDEDVRHAGDPIDAARRAKLSPPFDEIVAALILKSPGARARPAWAAGRLGNHQHHRFAGALARIRNVYLRLQDASLRRSTKLDPTDEPIAPWANWLVEWRLLGSQLSPEFAPYSASPRSLSQRDRLRWLVGIVGDSALSWASTSLGLLEEKQLLDCMLALCERASPEAWTSRDLDGDADTDTTLNLPSDATTHESAEARIARLAIEVMRVPVTDTTLDAIERAEHVPPALLIASARAARLRGEIARASALADRAVHLPEARALAADIARRAGDPDRAAQLLSDPTITVPTARACRARLALDAGRPSDAITEAGRRDAALVAEVVALAHAATGGTQRSVALAVLDAALGLPCDAEERARLHGARGYVLAPNNPRAALEAFETAAEHATLASARVEEATYRTGISATAVDLGRLTKAVHAAERAAILWEHLGETPRAARAWLNAAAAHAVGGRMSEAIDLGERAYEAAHLSGDLPAKIYALLVLSDARHTSAAQRALDLLTQSSDPAAEIELRVRARAQVDGSGGADNAALGDALAANQDAAISASARQDWWAARIRSSTEGGSPIAEWIGRIVTSLSEESSIGSRGPALAAALEAAEMRGAADAAMRLRAALQTTATLLLANAGELFADTAAELAWVRAARLDSGASTASTTELPREQTKQLERIVRGLASSERLGDLLRAIVDGLVMWTGAERGILLARAPDGRLVPRAGRNLARADLVGQQLGLSMSLARLAIERGEPVVAVDADNDLSDVHASVHALHLRSVLAVPLVARGEVFGVAYLDDRVRRGVFAEREVVWASTLATIAATLIARALAESKLKRAVRHASRSRPNEAQTHIVPLDPPTTPGSADAFANLIGRSTVMRQTISAARRMAASEVPIFLQGESGSGKELFARAIHAASERSARPFISENCGAIPETLLESALFGHVRGAFTGADRSRVGLFEAADGGTLFLDEIGEMSLAMQAKLLRILEDGIVRPLGTTRTTKVRVRLVTATHRDLETMVKAGTFREDLFYRLHVLALRIPPLRERREDIPALVARFLSQQGAPPTRISPAAMTALSNRPWPGNVRQLENEVRRAVVLSEGIIDLEHLSFRHDQPHASSTSAPRAREPDSLEIRSHVTALEIELVRMAMERTNNNQTKAAQLLGLSRFGLQKMLKRLAAP